MCHGAGIGSLLPPSSSQGSNTANSPFAAPTGLVNNPLSLAPPTTTVVNSLELPLTSSVTNLLDLSPPASEPVPASGSSLKLQIHPHHDALDSLARHGWSFSSFPVQLPLWSLSACGISPPPPRGDRLCTIFQWHRHCCVLSGYTKGGLQ